MSARVVAGVDWTRPWLAPYRALGEAATARLAAGASVAEALDGLRDLASGPSRVPRVVPRFVPQAELPAGEAYEAFIARTGRVPTREHLHDLFNGLVWLAHPAWKTRLNRLQAEAIARDGIGPVRGPLRDALTLFDENGAWLDGPAPLRQALAARDWAALFGPLRPQWAQARLVLVGHALLEQLAQAPRKGLTAHVLTSGAGADPLALAPADWARKPFCPLPVLGVPGWWPANDVDGFYDDAAVFRPAGPGQRPRGAPADA